jgi:hypothetical protein
MLNALVEIPTSDPRLTTVDPRLTTVDPRLTIPGYRPNNLAFLTNNWGALQATGEREYTRLVKVYNNVATITNGPVLLRAPVENIPNGFYCFNDAGFLIESPVRTYKHMQNYNNPFGPGDYFYPDPERHHPNFAALASSPPIPAEAPPPNISVRTIVDFLTHLQSISEKDYFEHRALVFFNEGALVSRQDPTIWLQIGFDIPVKPNQRFFRANLLRLLFIEMLRYTHVFIGVEHNDPSALAPLVVGHDWSRCGLIIGDTY